MALTMARQSPPRHTARWLPVFILVLLSTILLQLLLARSRRSSFSSSPSSDTSTSTTTTTKNSIHWRNNIRDISPPLVLLKSDHANHQNSIHAPTRRKLPWQRRADEDTETGNNDDLTDPSDYRGMDKNLLLSNGLMPELDSWGDSANEEDDPTMEASTSLHAASLASISAEQRSRGLGFSGPPTRLHQVDIAQTICNSITPQTLGPAWNGTFASNSPDGVYPSTNRTCTWTIFAAANNSSPGGATSPSPSPSPVATPLGANPKAAVTSPYIVAVTFSTPIQLVCGVDYLTLFDGPDASWPVIATLCGNIWMDTIPTLYSSGPVMTAVFSSQANTPGSFGFTALWYSALPCNVCLASGRGTCNANTCVCNSKTSGVVCNQDTAGYKEFLPRSRHAMAYDPVKDMVYITGGTNAQDMFLGVLDVLTYSFANNKWNKITASSTGGQKIPFARYGHFSFVYNGELYIYGGVSITGGMTDIWRFNGKQWVLQPIYNQELVPMGKAGAACVLITINNSTQLVSFGGIDANNNTMRELYMYDIKSSMWKQSAHKNSVGLSGASAVFHPATGSIYFFGGMVNQTTRNTVVFQYSIQQDLWYELAPRIDPLTATPVTPLNGQAPSNPFNSTNDDGSDSGEESGELHSNVTTYLPPVMYDPLSGVWAPASLMGDDTVVIYGGMRPFGPGVNVRDQSCYVRTISIYDLSCQKWTSYEAADLGGVLYNRVNHTMVIRPPGAPGGSKTSYTAYVFGGFDGRQHADMLNITLSIPTPPPSEVNNCRALRWCAYYDDCQYCNVNYCSYVGGLCLFDTDKAKTPLNPTSPPYLLGASADIPKNGTIQDLIRQRPDLKSQIITPDECPIRLLLQLGTTYSNSIQSGQVMTFNIYIDAPDRDIQYEIRTNPAQTLSFKSLNVWEGFMNMYWRADHGLTDNSWNGYSGTCSPIPPDAVDDNDMDVALISPAGFLNVSELENRWQRYAGLDNSPTSSALTAATNSYIFFPADDPRRFSGYYVFSLTNNHSTAMSFTLTVSLLDRPTPVGPNPGSKFNLATLGYFMVGFVMCVLLLIVLGRKIRQFLERRDLEMRAAAEARMLEEEEAEAEAEERRRLAMALRGENGGDMKDWKPMYKVVLGVQAKRQQDALEDEKGWSSARNLSTTSLLSPRHAGRGGSERPFRKASLTSTSATTANDLSHDLLPRSQSDSAVPREGSDARPKSDFIRDLGSSPQVSSVGDASVRSLSTSGVSMDAVQEEEDLKQLGKKESSAGSTTSSSRKISIRLDRHPSHTSQGFHHAPHGTQDDLRSGSGSGVQRGWSLKSLSRSTSLKRIRDHSKVNPEEMEGLTSQPQGDTSLELDRQLQLQGNDSEQEVIELDVMSRQRNGRGHDAMYSPPSESSQWELGQHVRRQQQRIRNPIRVQPISIEPLPFHGGLVARTRRNFKRYQRTLARSAITVQGQAQYEYEEERRKHSLRKTNLSRSSAGSLRTAHGAASRMASLTRRATPSPSAGGVGDEYQQAVVDIPLSDDEGAVDPAEATPTPEPGHFGAGMHGPPRKEGREMPKRKPIRMRGRQEFEPGPLLAMNVLIVFPGDAGTRSVQRLSEEDGEDQSEATRKTTTTTATNSLDSINEDQRLPSMAIGTVFVPDPVRWWAYKAQQQRDRLYIDMQMKKKSSLNNY